MVSNGPMKDQRKPRPAEIVLSMSAVEATPSLNSAQASFKQRALQAIEDKKALHFVVGRGLAPGRRQS